MSVSADPDLMNAGEFRAEMARRNLRIEDLPFSPKTVVKLRKGYTSVGFNSLIEIGAFLGLRPRLVWERIPVDEAAKD